MQGQRDRALDTRVQRAIGAAGVGDSHRKSDTYKEFSSWAVPDGNFDAWRVESNDGDATTATTGQVTIPDPSDNLGDPVVKQTMKKLIETAKRLLANRNVPGSGVIAPYETIDDACRRLSQETMTRTVVSDTALPTRSSKVPDRKIREMPMKKMSRVIDVQKNNQVKNNFTGVPDTDLRACFNRSTWSPAVNLQQPPLGTSHLILGDSLVRVLQNLRTSWITTVMAFGDATIAQLFRMVELMNSGRIPNISILIGTNNVSRGSDEEEVDHGDFMRGIFAKFGPSCFFCNLEGHFKSDCPQFWDAVADIKHPRHEEV